MANLKLNNVTAISESGGAITVPALGTVTSGDLSNTALVFPTGHVLQVIQGTPNTTNYSSNSLTEVVCTNWTATINKSISGSSIFASWHCTYQIYQGNTTTAAELYIDFDRTAPSSSTGINQQYSYIADEGGDTYHNIYTGHSGSFVDTSSATGNHTYIAHIRGGFSGNATPTGAIKGTLGESTLVLMEVVT